MEVGKMALTHFQHPYHYIALATVVPCPDPQYTPKGGSGDKLDNSYTGCVFNGSILQVPKCWVGAWEQG